MKIAWQTIKYKSFAIKLENVIWMQEQQSEKTQKNKTDASATHINASPFSKFFSSFLNDYQPLGQSLVVNSLAVSSHGSLLESLSKSRVSVRSSGNIFRRSTVLECQNTLGDHLTGVGADNVDTEDTVSLGISEELDHTVRVGVGLCSRVGREGERTNLVLDTGLLEFSLVLTNPGDFGVCVHD
jgi:hypothetical protein